MAGNEYWFYSSLAQSSASFVGVMAAVIGTRLIGHVEEMRKRRRDMDGLVGNVIELMHRKRPGYPNIPRVAELFGPLYVDRAIEGYLRDRAAEIKEFAAGPVGASQVGTGWLNQDAGDLENVANQISAFRRGLIPPLYWLAAGVFAFMLMFTVVLPLRVLPGFSDKDLFLIALGIGTAAFEAFFLWEFRELGRLGDIP